MKRTMSVCLRGARLAAACAAALLFTACAALRPPGSLPIGTSIDEARQGFGGASGEYPMSAGGTRLEFRQHKQTYMLDFDATGRLVARQQVLTPAVFATIRPGMSQGDVLYRIGHPVSVFPVGWQHLQVWNYRFGGLEGDCVMFQVSFANATRLVTETGQGMDPACDGPNRAK
jgi:hypothetical protein